jgi:hypothetical protein
MYILMMLMKSVIKFCSRLVETLLVRAFLFIKLYQMSFCFSPKYLVLEAYCDFVYFLLCS